MHHGVAWFRKLSLGFPTMVGFHVHVEAGRIDLDHRWASTQHLTSVCGAFDERMVITGDSHGVLRVHSRSATEPHCWVQLTAGVSCLSLLSSTGEIAVGRSDGGVSILEVCNLRALLNLPSTARTTQLVLTLKEGRTACHQGWSARVSRASLRVTWSRIRRRRSLAAAALGEKFMTSSAAG